MAEKKNKIIWEEISFSEPSIEAINDSSGFSAINTVQEVETEEKKSIRKKLEIQETLKTLKESVRESYDVIFVPEKFIQTNILGEIFFKSLNEIEFKSNYLIQASTEQEKRIIQLFEEIVNFFENNFIEEEIFLEIISTYLIQKNRLADLVAVSNKYLAKGKLPLKFQIFFILTGIYENNLRNLVLSGDEKIVVNILYKYKFLEISKSEKNYLYDLVVSGRSLDFLGIVFQLYKNEFKGIRNISPLFNLVADRFSSLSIEEKQSFLQSYQNTFNYLKIYFFMKKCYSNLQIDTWVKAMNVMNGKDKTIQDQIEEELKEVPEKNKLTQKYILLKERGSTYHLSPFEILLLCNSTVSLDLRQEISNYYEKYPMSYIANRSIAVLYFYEEDYKKFLIQIAKSGNFRYQMEVLYLKAMAYRQLNLEKESSKIFQALYKRFPESEILANELIQTT